jgi:Alcohol dehydrogenase GroES-like domain
MRVFVTGATGSGSSDSHREVELPISFSALAIEQAGAPVTLKKKSIESLNDDEVLIRVSYASINKMDPGLARRNIFNLPEPYVLGFDFSGELVKLGGEGKDALQVIRSLVGPLPAAASRSTSLLRGRMFCSEALRPHPRRAHTGSLI